MKKFFSLVVLFFVITTYGAVTVNVNGSNYSIPQTNERGWGTAVTSWIQAISSNTLQPIGGSFTLSNDVDFGPNFGLKSSYLLSRNTNPSTAGLLRLNVADSIGWRNNANNGNLLLGVNGSNQLTFNGSALLSSGNIVNADISASAGIDASKIANGQVSNAEFQALDGVAAPIVTTTGTQSVSNKDIDGGTASNTNRLTIPKNTLTNLQALTRKQATIFHDTTSNKPYFDDGTSIRPFGLGSGTSNLIDDGDAEAGITNYVEGSYAAATRPAGTFTSSSGAGAFAISTSTSNPIFGNTSFLLTKSSGASRQGRAIERTIPLDAGYRGKVLKTRIDYTIVSGSFVAGTASTDSSLIWYIGQFNGTTWSYTEPSNFKMYSTSTTLPDYVEGDFQVNSDTTQIKLIAYVAETANSAWVVKCEVGLRVATYASGATVSAPRAVTFTGSWNTNTTYSGFRRQVGNEYEYTVKVLLSGAPNAANLTINLPSGDTIDTSLLASTTQYASAFESSGSAWSSPSAYAVKALYNNTTSIVVGYISNGSTSAQSIVSNSIPVTWASGGEINLRFSLPIVGLQSNTAQSDGYDSRLIAAQASTTSQTITAGGTRFIVDYSTKTYDKSNAITTGASWKFTAPSYGIYDVKIVNGHGSAAVTAGAQVVAEVYKNGTLYKPIAAINQHGSGSIAVVLSGAIEIEMNAGDYFDVREALGGSTNISINDATIYISKKQSPQTISATEIVAMKYVGIPTGSIGPASNAITYPTKVFDTHNAYSGGVYTIPVSGFYSVTASTDILGTETLDHENTMSVTLDGVNAGYLGSTRSPGTVTSTTVKGGTILWANAGQLLRIICYTAVTSPSYGSNAIQPEVSIYRIK